MNHERTTEYSGEGCRNAARCPGHVQAVAYFRSYRGDFTVHYRPPQAGSHANSEAPVRASANPETDSEENRRGVYSAGMERVNGANQHHYYAGGIK